MTITAQLIGSRASAAKTEQRWHPAHPLISLIPGYFRYFRSLSIDTLNIRVFSLSKRCDNWVIRLRRSAPPLISWIIRSFSERWKLASWQPSILIIVKRVHSDGGAEDGWIGWSVCGLNGHVLPAALDIKAWWTALSLSKHSRMNTAAGRDTGPLC